MKLRERLLDAFAAAVLILLVTGPLLWVAGWHGYVVEAILSPLLWGTRFAPDLSRDGLLTLHRGQDIDDVLEVLGEPLSRVDRQADREILQYAEGGVEIYLWFDDRALTRASVQQHDCEFMRLNDAGVMELIQSPSWTFSWILPRV